MQNMYFKIVNHNHNGINFLQELSYAQMDDALIMHSDVTNKTIVGIPVMNWIAQIYVDTTKHQWEHLLKVPDFLRGIHLYKTVNGLLKHLKVILLYSR